MYHFLFLLHLPFCSLQHKPVFLHTVLGLNFIWFIYSIHKIHKKIDSARSNGWSLVNEWMKMYHQIKFSTVYQLTWILWPRLTMFYCFIKFAYFKSEFPLFIFVLAHLQKLLIRSIHFKTRTFFPSVFLPLVIWEHSPPHKGTQTQLY